jgi:hypothetical protein
MTCHGRIDQVIGDHARIVARHPARGQDVDSEVFRIFNLQFHLRSE